MKKSPVCQLLFAMCSKFIIALHHTQFFFCFVLKLWSPRRNYRLVLDVHANVVAYACSFLQFAVIVCNERIINSQLQTELLGKCTYSLIFDWYSIVRSFDMHLKYRKMNDTMFMYIELIVYFSSYRVDYLRKNISQRSTYYFLVRHMLYHNH